jgi:hypothetical protein
MNPISESPGDQRGENAAGASESATPVATCNKKRPRFG